MAEELSIEWRGRWIATISQDSKVKPFYRPQWPMGLALNSSFFSMKQLGVLLLRPGWDANASQGYPPAYLLVAICTPG